MHTFELKIGAQFVRESTAHEMITPEVDAFCKETYTEMKAGQILA